MSQPPQINSVRLMGLQETIATHPVLWTLVIAIAAFVAGIASYTMIPNWWPVIIFGAPGFIASLVASAAGIFVKRPIFLRLGAMLAIPSAYYIGGIPGWWPALFLLPVMHLVAAAAVRRSRRLLAVCALLPNVAAAVLLTAITVRNSPA